MASKPVIETCRMTLKRLTEDRKRGSRIANTAISTSRNMRGAKRAKNENASKSLPVFAATLSVIPGPIKLHAATRSSSAS